MTLDGSLILLHGGVLAAAASAFALGLLRYNPRLFLKHFPEKVRAAQPPLSRSETMAGVLLGAPFMLLLAGGPIASTLIFGAARAADPISLWAHAFIVGMMMNLADWLVVDELWLGVGKPRWALPSGVQRADVTPFEHGRHFADFLKGVIFFAVVAGLASLIATLAGGHGGAGQVVA